MIVRAPPGTRRGPFVPAAGPRRRGGRSRRPEAARAGPEVLTFLVVDGLLRREIVLHDRRATELLGPADVVDGQAVAEGSVPLEQRWAADEPVTPAVLDERFITAARQWPAPGLALHRRLCVAYATNASPELGGYGTMPGMDPNRLRSISLMSELADEDLRRVAVFATEDSVGEGTALVREGDFSTELIGIEEGTADVVRNGEVIATLGAGDLFGEMGLLEKELRSATVVATSPMRVVKLTHWDIRRLPKQTVERLRGVVAERRARDARRAGAAGAG